MKIKQECLDLKVASPQNGRAVILRFVPEGLYNRFFEAYPHVFESSVETKLKVKKDVISTTESTNEA